jgi:hypothetical protein
MESGYDFVDLVELGFDLKTLWNLVYDSIDLIELRI